MAIGYLWDLQPSLYQGLQVMKDWGESIQFVIILLTLINYISVPHPAACGSHLMVVRRGLRIRTPYLLLGVSAIIVDYSSPNRIFLGNGRS